MDILTVLNCQLKGKKLRRNMRNFSIICILFLLVFIVYYCRNPKENVTLTYLRSEQTFAPNLTIQIGLGDLDGDGDKDIIGQHSVWFNQSGPIARFGSAPTIDGVFEEGEWDDAEVVRAGEYQRFRIKHDGKNLYFALVGGGGDLWFNKDAGLHILHSSSQLGSAEYIKSDSSVQSLSKPFDYRLWYGICKTDQRLRFRKNWLVTWPRTAGWRALRHLGT